MTYKCHIKEDKNRRLIITVELDQYDRDKFLVEEGIINKKTIKNVIVKEPIN